MKNKNIITGRFVFSILIILLISYQYSFSQITTDNSVNLSQLVSRIFGHDVTVSNVSLKGDAMASGTFDGTASNIGINYGIILSTGYISNATGPNDDPVNGSPIWSNIIKSKDFGKPGDTDLNTLQGCSGCTNDAVVMEFDIVPKSSLISLKYVFASEEYPFYVCSDFNDIFGLFISGPKPGGGNYLKQNIALIPGTTIPVSINAINSGTPGYDPNCPCYWPTSNCTSLAYSNLFVENGDGSTPDLNKTVQYNGFTVPLTASVNVIPNISYHVKIAIADVLDGKYDSALLMDGATLSLDAGDDNSILCGDSVQLNATTKYIGNAKLNYQWSPSEGLSATDIPNPIAKPSNTTIYSVTLTIPGIGSFVDSVKIFLKLMPPEEICYVEFDSLTLKNSINWKTNLSSKIDSVNIYNEVSTDIWKLIGSVSSAKHNFIDVNSNPSNQSYSYKISVKDTCGYETLLSAFHTTITLFAAFDSGTNTYGFTWSPYKGLFISNYFLYGVTANGTETFIVTLPGNQYFYNYIDPNPAFVKYFVAFNAPSCSGKSTHLVRSNYVEKVTGISAYEGINKSISIFPNPANEKIIISYSNYNANDKPMLELLNITGELLKSQKIQSESSAIDISDLANGIYFIKINTLNNVVYKRIIKE